MPHYTPTSFTSVGYVVIRTFMSRHGKRKFVIALGPFPTRGRAETRKRQAIRDHGYDSSELTIGVLRTPSEYADLDLETIGS